MHVSSTLYARAFNSMCVSAGFKLNYILTDLSDFCLNTPVSGPTAGQNPVTEKNNKDIPNKSEKSAMSVDLSVPDGL